MNIPEYNKITEDDDLLVVEAKLKAQQKQLEQEKNQTEPRSEINEKDI